MKTQEEINALKEEVKGLKEKLSALTEEELKIISGGGPTTTEGYWCTDARCPYSSNSECPKYWQNPELLCNKK